MDYIEYFAGGFAFGMTTVIVGQPFDTLKTRLQSMPNVSVYKFIREQGIKGLYQGASSVIIGSVVFRSVQFTAFGSALSELRLRNGDGVQSRIGMIDYNLLLAGALGGICRGFVEGPFEYIKVRRQVNIPWKWNEVFQGLHATILRNSLLFSSFVIYIDISKQLIPGGLSPLMQGVVCGNLCWLTIWPLDVVKSQIQSGNFSGKSYAKLLIQSVRSGRFFNGLGPGLLRSTFANGCSMVVYRRVQEWFAERKSYNRGRI
jgi:solute carrier family 25 carnitine/acylcarnitine transporter 20/29